MEIPIDPDQVSIGLRQPLLPFTWNCGDWLWSSFELPGQLAVVGQGVVDCSCDVLVGLVKFGAILYVMLVPCLPFLLAEMVDRAGAFEVGEVGCLAEVSVGQEHPASCLGVNLLFVLGTGLLLG